MRLAALTVVLLLAGCTRASGEGGGDRLVFVYQPLGSDPRPLQELIDGYAAAHPEVKLELQLIPNASDVAHQYFLTALEGGSTAFDVFVIDTVWVSEFAKAGWIADLTAAFPPQRLAAEFLEGAASAVTVEGRVYAVPWYIDVGLLYYRTDLVPRAPRTYEELRQFAREAKAKDPSLAGYAWQGRQYEGMVCNVFEAMWGHGAKVSKGAQVELDTEAGRAGLDYLRGLITEGISPASVTSAAEEDSRRLFQSGRAVMMRNWPYAWDEAQKEGSPIAGKVAFAPLPTLSGEPGWGTLGGWQLAVNAHLPPQRRERAIALVRQLTSEAAMLRLAQAYGRNPPRRSVYEQPEVAPFISALLPIFERARPRPVTPYYGLMSDAIQSEFSAAIVGVDSPATALQRLQRQLDRIAGEAP
ncbi:MAG: ABC transporter substrate-binding protein [Myxococcota bacterium]|nr:ABC transporter substrate-binding protein [Myxococcota bacterium]